VVSVLSQQALEAYGAQVIFTKSLDLLGWMYLASAILELTYLIVTHINGA
jgi:hypothetical protein